MPAPGPRIPPDVRTAILEYASDGHSAPDIADVLNRDPTMRGRVPGVRAIQKIARGAGPRWSVATGDPDDAALVLEVLGAIVTHYQGGIRTISTRLAALVVMIRRAAPECPPLHAYRLATRYQHKLDAPAPATREFSDPHRELSLHLALGLWDARKEAEAFAVGWVDTIGGDNEFLNRAIDLVPDSGPHDAAAVTVALQRVLEETNHD